MCLCKHTISMLLRAVSIKHNSIKYVPILCVFFVFIGWLGGVDGGRVPTPSGNVVVGR